MTGAAARLDAILDVLMAFARQDFSPRIPVSVALDEFDAIATGINMLAEELHGEVASRRELEAAYAALQATQSQLLVAEKLAAIGQLASGVAHELNNPAAWVILNVDRARSIVADARATSAPVDPLSPLFSELETSLADVHAGMVRIRAVVSNLRAFARIDDAHTKIDLDEVIRDACHLALPSFRGVARLVLDLGELPPIVGDRTRLGQMITNLVINAAQAIGVGGPDHEIAIATTMDGHHVLLTVEDTGPGIPETLRERVFEPYFTTKPLDVGTGLGLALVREIATQHGGTARIDASHARSGARVEVRLPLQRPCPLAPAREQSAVTAATRRVRILIIDDEPMLLRALADALGGTHDTVTAHGGAESLAMFAHDRDFDLILCDLQMPGVDGVAVHDALAQTAPELLDRIVFMSGGAVTVRARDFIARVRPRVFDKPLDLDAILTLAARISRAKPDA